MHQSFGLGHYRLYFKSSEGKYHYGMYFDSLEEALSVAFEYRRVVPAIMITTRKDCSVFEMSNGVIEFPDDELVVPPSLKQAQNLPEEDGQYYDDIDLQASRTLIADKRKLEAMLLGAAARDGINLYEYGWQPLPQQIEKDPDYKWTGDAWVRSPLGGDE